MPKDYLDPICNIRYSCQKLYCKKKLSDQKPTTILQFAIQEEQLYAECGARLKNFPSSNLLCVYPSLFAIQPTLTKQNIAYTKNSQQFLASQVSVLRGNKANNSSASNIPFSVALKAFVLVYYSTFLNLSSHSHGRVVCHLGIKMKKV